MLSTSEKPARKVNGFVMSVVTFLLILAGVWSVVDAVKAHDTTMLWFFFPDILVAALLAPGFFIVHPNEARVLVFLGRYSGSVLQAGFWWTNPLTVKRPVSLRVHNFNSEKLKVNDLNGNPIEIAAVIVWRVVDSAKALFDVESYEERKASMVNNLLVALVADREAQPVINTGTLYA